MWKLSRKINYAEIAILTLIFLYMMAIAGMTVYMIASLILATFKIFAVDSANQQKIVGVTIVFAMYLMVILGFAIKYNTLFKFDPSSFAFAEEVARSQREVKIAEAKVEVELWEAAEKILLRIREELRGEGEAIIAVDKWSKATNGGSLSFECVKRLWGKAEYHQPTFVVREGERERDVFSWSTKDAKGIEDRWGVESSIGQPIQSSCIFLTALSEI